MRSSFTVSSLLFISLLAYRKEVTDLKYDKEVNRIPLLEAEVKRSEADWFKGVTRCHYREIKKLSSFL